MSEVDDALSTLATGGSDAASILLELGATPSECLRICHIMASVTSRLDPNTPISKSTMASMARLALELIRAG